MARHIIRESVAMWVRRHRSMARHIEESVATRVRHQLAFFQWPDTAESPWQRVFVTRFQWLRAASCAREFAFRWPPPYFLCGSGDPGRNIDGPVWHYDHGCQRFGNCDDECQFDWFLTCVGRGGERTCCKASWPSIWAFCSICNHGSEYPNTHCCSASAVVAPHRCHLLMML